MKCRRVLAVSLAAAIIVAGCHSGLDPSRALHRDPLEIEELRGARSVAIVPAQGDFCVWSKRGRIKAEGWIAAGSVAAAIGVGSIMAAGWAVTATGVVVFMTPVAAVATAGVGVVAFAAVLALDAAVRDAQDRGLERALREDLAFRPELKCVEGMKRELRARYGIQVLDVNDLAQGKGCDVVVLVRTWRYGIFRVYSDENPLRAFQYMTVHVVRNPSLSPEVLSGLREFAAALPGADCSSTAGRLLEDEQLWFGSKAGKPVASWKRMMMGRMAIESSETALKENAAGIRSELETLADTLGQRYGFHMALSMQ